MLRLKCHRAIIFMGAGLIYSIGMSGKSMDKLARAGVDKQYAR